MLCGFRANWTLFEFNNEHIPWTVHCWLLSLPEIYYQMEYTARHFHCYRHQYWTLSDLLQLYVYVSHCKMSKFVPFLKHQQKKLFTFWIKQIAELNSLQIAVIYIAIDLILFNYFHRPTISTEFHPTDYSVGLLERSQSIYQSCHSKHSRLIK